MSKEAKPDASERRRKVRPGSTLRLELHLSTLASLESRLSCRDVGELFEMLMDEAAQMPVHPASSSLVQGIFDLRDTFRVIKGGFGRATLSMAKRKAIYERDAARCGYCGAGITWAEYHCDHVEPVSKGGSDAPDNLKAACCACNLSKADKSVSEWIH